MGRIQQADLIGNLARDPQLLASLLDSAPVMITYKSRALAGETVHFEQCVSYPKRGKRQVLVSYVPHEDATGRVVGLFTLVQDITKLSGARPASAGPKRRVERESVLKSGARPA